LKALIPLMLAVLGTSLAIPLNATDGLIARWALDEANGSVVVDSSGNGFEGTAYGAQPAPSPLNGARSFEEPAFVGIPDALSVPAQIAALDRGSISVWFRIDEVLPVSTLLPILYLGNNDISPNDEAIVIELGHGAVGGTVLYFTYYLHGSTPLCFDTIFNLEVGVWHHFVVTVGPDFNTAYLNGQELTGRDYNAGGPGDRYFFSDVPNPQVLWLGKGYAKELPELRYHDGLIDEVSIYSRALTAQEVEALWILGGPPTTIFQRGDINSDGVFDLADPIGVLDHLFGTGGIACESAADSNDDGSLDLSDAIHALGSLFGFGPEPLAPFPDCGAELTPDTLSCSDPGC
jgi:hypothetical protein